MNEKQAAKLTDDQQEAECARLMALVEGGDEEAIDLVAGIIQDHTHPLIFPMMGKVIDFIDPPEKQQTLAEVFAEARQAVDGLTPLARAFQQARAEAERSRNAAH